MTHLRTEVRDTAKLLRIMSIISCQLSFVHRPLSFVHYQLSFVHRPLSFVIWYFIQSRLQIFPKPIRIFQTNI